MPLRRSSFPTGAAIQLYRHATWGNLLDLNFLDTRQFRTAIPCDGTWASTCDAVRDPAAQVMGEAQEQWLYRNLDRTQAHWKVLAQQIMVMDLDRKEGPEQGYNLDTWAGYAIPRQRLLDRLRERRIGNTIILTGDEHQNYAGELYRDSRNPEGAPIASEFVTTSISSSGDGQDQRADGRRYFADNPFLKFNNAQRGYVVCDVTPEVWKTEFKVLDKVSDKTGTLTTRATLAAARDSESPARWHSTNWRRAQSPRIGNRAKRLPAATWRAIAAGMTPMPRSCATSAAMLSKPPTRMRKKLSGAGAESRDHARPG